MSFFVFGRVCGAQSATGFVWFRSFCLVCGVRSVQECEKRDVGEIRFGLWRVKRDVGLGIRCQNGKWPHGQIHRQYCNLKTGSIQERPFLY